MNELSTNLGWAVWLNDSVLNEWVLSQWYIWPTLETLHFIGLCILLSGLLVVDLRLLGFFKNLSLNTARTYIRITLIGFAINFMTGICFLAGNTWKYAEGNLAFDIKLILITILGVNAVVFHRKIEPLLHGSEVTALSRLVGGVSLLLWCLVIVCGRMITFFASTG